MLTNAWMKHLPVLSIVIKSSLMAEQQVALNASDFGRAGFTQKSGYKFLLKIKEGNLSNMIINMPIASMMATTLLEDKAIGEFLSMNEFYISLNPRYELTVKHAPQQQPKSEIAAVEAG